MAIKLICYKNKESYDITQIVTKVVWSGDINSCSRKLEFLTISSATDKHIPNFDIPLSSHITLYEDDNELFRGFVFEREKDSNSTTTSYLCFDYAQKLSDIKISYNIKNKTANEIMDMVLKDYKLDVGKVAKANTKVKKVFLGVSIYEMIQTAYTEQSKKDNKKYMIYADKGTINSMEKGVTKLKVKFEEGKNIDSSTFKESVSNMVNKVIIVDENGNKKSEVKDENMQKIHGLFQQVYKIEEGKDSNLEAKNMLKGVEKTCSLTGYGDTTCRTGYGVEVKDSHTGLVGHFYIDADTHTWEGNKYFIDLDLNFNNIMHEVSVGEDEQEQASLNSVSSGTAVSGGKEVDAEFTAYYPSNDPMQGGYKAANGETLKPSSLTCAAPKEVAFNTKIQVKGTGTSRDGIVYRVNDRGGAIKIVNGVYKIDLLMSSKKEAYAFGRRKGKAIIGVEVTNNGGVSSSNNSKVNKMIELAKSKIGNSYVWGATGPNSFDCSGLTQYLHKQVGINIPRTSGEQSKSGKSVSRDNIQAGDLIFFDTMGKGRVSHVGFMISSTRMIHASSPKNGIKYDDITSKYYKSKYINARRYW